MSILIRHIEQLFADMNKMPEAALESLLKDTPYAFMALASRVVARDLNFVLCVDDGEQTSTSGAGRTSDKQLGWFVLHLIKDFAEDKHTVALAVTATMVNLLNDIFSRTDLNKIAKRCGDDKKGALLRLLTIVAAAKLEDTDPFIFNSSVQGVLYGNSDELQILVGEINKNGPVSGTSH